MQEIEIPEADTTGIEFDIPDSGQDYGDESFVYVDDIVFNRGHEQLLITINDPDHPGGFYHYGFGAEETEEGGVRVTKRAVGVPPIQTHRDHEDTTIIDVLDDTEGITFSQELEEESY